MSKTATYVSLPIFAVALGAVIQVARPVPPVQLQGTPSPIKLPGTFTVDLPGQGQAAVGEESLGVVAQTPNELPVPIASLTKMMTAYLLLQAHPLTEGQDGPMTTMTAGDVATYQRDKAAGDSVVKVTAGEQLTERQMLEALLLPSADNIATTIADQLAGSEATFVTRMNQAAKALGMSQTTYTDAAGVNPATVSTARDQLLVAQAVMKSRIFRQIVREPQADLPVAGLVYNVDFMVGKQGISGIKTGSTLEAGSCFVGSYPVIIDGKPRIALASILGQQSLQVALTKDAAILHQIAPQFKDYPVPLPSRVGQLTTAWRQQANLELSQPVQVFGYPGMPVGLGVKLTQARLPISAGAEVATLTVSAGDVTETLGLSADQPIGKPGLWWRFYR